MAPVGVESVQADEMTVLCGAGTPVEDLDAELAAFGQCVLCHEGISEVTQVSHFLQLKQTANNSGLVHL